MQHSIICHQTTTELDSIKENWQLLKDDNQEIPKMVEADIDYLKYQMSEGLLGGTPLVCSLHKDNLPHLLSIGVVKTVNITPSIAYLKLNFLKMKKKCYHIYPYAVFGDSEDVVKDYIRSIHSVLKENEIDYIFFSLLPKESNLGKNLLKIRNPLISDPVPVSTEHFILNVPENLEAFLETKDGKSRGKLRRIIKRVHKEYENNFEIKVFTEADDTDLFFDHAEKISQKSHLRPLNIGFRATPEEQNRKKWLAQNGFFRSYILYLNGTPTSFVVGINYNRHYYVENIGFDMAYEKLRLGTYLRLKVIEDVAKTKCADIIDYGHGSDEYKQNFSSRQITSTRIKLYKPKFSHIFFITYQVFFSLLNKGGRYLLQKTKVYDKVRKLARTILMKKKKI
jgi:hypothetical protein